jgi:hypothetical protein
MQDLKATLLSCTLSKSPGPNGLRYEHWSLFHPTVLQAMTAALNHELCNFDWDHKERTRSESTSSPPKKDRGRDIRPLSLIETTVKLIDKIFIRKLSFLSSTHIPFLREQDGFRTGVSGGDPMTDSASTWCHTNQYSWSTYFSGFKGSAWSFPFDFWNQKGSHLNGYHTWAK